MRIAAFVAVLLLLAGALRATVSAAQYDVADQTAAHRQLEAAWHDLAAGRAREAYRSFRAQREYWSGFQVASQGYVDAATGMMIAAILAEDDARADDAWREIGPNVQPGDDLVFAGRWNDAFRAYRDATQDLAMEHPRAPEHDRVVSAGVERALRGDYRGAIRAWSAPADGGGVFDLTDVQVALIGLAYARVRDWPAAESAWVRAARIRRNIPQMAEFEAGNYIALGMLRHFRAHFARGEGRYRLPAAALR